MIFWAGCNAEKHYQLLTFFFDGVPDPRAQMAHNRGETVEITALGARRIILSTHKPFEEKKCQECHNPGVNPNTPASEVRALPAALDASKCTQCHDKLSAAFPVMHQAVLNRSCLWCHDPHDSTSPKLLRTTGNTICLQCHEQQFLSVRQGHQVVPKKKVDQCLSCHGGHGGSDRAILAAKPLVAPAQERQRPQFPPLKDPFE